MKIDRGEFFTKIKQSLFNNKLSQVQVDGVEMVLDEWEKRNYTDIRWLAYMLATIYHETGATMQPIREWGRGKGLKYGIPDKITGKTYYGRGWVQLTWKANYRKMGELLGVDLVNDPDLALRPDIATEILFEGMLTEKSYRGDFTGRSLEQYFNETTEDPFNARRIINGMDKSKLIASYYEEFKKALI